MQALEGVITVEVRPSNAVLSVRVDPVTVPDDPVPAGTSISLSVLLETEDQQPLSLEDAQQGLTLNLIAPGANSKAAQVTAVQLCTYSSLRRSPTASLCNALVPPPPQTPAFPFARAGRSILTLPGTHQRETS